MKILVLAPHPDDEVLGCGGTIAKLAARGHQVYLGVVTEGYAPEWSEKFLSERPKEVARSNKILGVKKTFFLGFPTVKLDAIPRKKLNESILGLVKKLKPEAVYLPHGGDVNWDHRLVFEAGLVALRTTNRTSVKKILCYETLSETAEIRGLKTFVPGVFENIEGEFKKKIKAMQAYKSEVKKFPHPRSLEMMKVLAKKRGAEAGFKLAEAFMTIREIYD